MIFIDSEIFQNLNSICPTYMGYVKEYQELPCISYLCTDNSTARRLDGEEYFSHLVYKVDLFCDHNDDYQSFAERVDDTMQSIGFKREQMVYLQDVNTHICFYYSGYIDNKSRYIYDGI